MGADAPEQAPPPADRRRRFRRDDDRAKIHARHELRRKLIRENWYRDVWLLVITGVVLLVLVGITNVLDEVQDGRRTTLSVLCASTSAVIDAGRATITGTESTLSPEFERNLEKLGYPPRKVRKAQAQKAAAAYAKIITEAVRRRAGPDAEGVVNPDGTLNCRKLQEVGRAR